MAPVVDADRARRVRLEDLITQYKAGEIDDRQLHEALQKLSQNATSHGRQTNPTPSIYNSIRPAFGTVGAALSSLR